MPKLHSVEFGREACARMLAGEAVLALAKELDVGFPVLHDWVEIPIPSGRSGAAYVGGINARETNASPREAAASIHTAVNALNASFYFGGYSGSRFSWVGGW